MDMPGSSTPISVGVLANLNKKVKPDHFNDQAFF